MTYTWKEGTYFNSDPQAAGDHLEQLKAANNGKLKPSTIVDSARPTTSPIHNDFEWDDSIAAEKHRKDQARRLVRCVLVIDEPTIPDETPAFVHIKMDNKGDNEYYYTDVGTAMADPNARSYVLKKALREAVQFRNRYVQYLELAVLCSAIEETKVLIELETA